MKGDHPGGFGSNPVKGLLCLGQGRKNGGDGNKLDFGHILKLEPRGFANREHVSYGRKRKRRR